MLGSLKNSTSEKSPNFPHLKMLRIEFRFDRKLRPSMEIWPSIILLMDCRERPKKEESVASAATQCLLLRLSLIPCYIFII